MGHRVGNIGTGYLNMATEQGCGGGSATLQSHVVQLMGINPNGFGQECGLYPVLSWLPIAPLKPITTGAGLALRAATKSERDR